MKRDVLWIYVWFVCSFVLLCKYMCEMLLGDEEFVLLGEVEDDLVIFDEEVSFCCILNNFSNDGCLLIGGNGDLRWVESRVIGIKSGGRIFIRLVIFLIWNLVCDW